MKNPKKINEEIIADNWFRKIISKNFLDKNWQKSNFLISTNSGIKESIVVLCLTKNNKIIYLNEFRYWVEKEVINFPMWGVEKWLNHIENVKKELKEETWYSSNNIKFLWETMVSNYNDVKIFHYIAMECEEWIDNLESTEYIEYKKIDLIKFEKMILNWLVCLILT